MGDNNIFDDELNNAATEVAQESNDFGSALEGLSEEQQEQFHQIQSLAKMDPSFANSQEYKDLMASVQQSSTSTSSKSNDDDDYEDDEDEDEEDDKDIFGISKPTKKEKEVKLTFEPTKEMADFISSNYGVEDVTTFFSSVNTWRNQAQEGVKAQKDYEALSLDLQSLPPEVKRSIELWANGEDHMSAFEVGQRLDFSADFSKQNTENLVQHYLPEEYDELVDQYENDEIDEDEFEKQVNLLAKTTKRFFTEDKKALDKDREDYLNHQKNYAQNLKKTALLSVENLSKTYPNFSKSELAKVRSILVEGKVEDLFSNSDGTYKDTAAEFVAFAMFGKDMMELMLKKGERQGESKANRKTVDSSPTTVKKQSSSNQQPGLDMGAVGHLGGLFKKDPYS